MRLKSSLNFSLITTGMAISFATLATPVTTGEFILDFDEAALAGLPTKIVNSVWYDETDSTNKTATELLTGKPQGPAPDSFTFKVFGSTFLLHLLA